MDNPRASSRAVASEPAAELRRVNYALHVLSAINQALIHADDDVALMREACRIAVELGGYRLAWVGLAQHDAAKNVKPIAWAGEGSDYVQSVAITWADSERGRGPTGLSIRTGKTHMARNILEDPKMAPWRLAAREHGYKSSIALPLTHAGHTFGALMMYATEPNAFDDHEAHILEELADDLAFGISTIRMRHKVEAKTHEIDELKNEFINIVSHQLRTPLGVVRWCLESLIARERGELQPQQIETLRSAYAANTEVIKRIDDLLTALDIQQSHLRLNVQVIDIGVLFQKVCEEKMPQSHLKNIHCHFNLPSDTLPVLKVDPIITRDVIMRLIDNALTYTDDGGSISVSCFAKDKQVYFKVSDTGIGIPASEQPRIFERFHRAWNAAKIAPDASGLGLYIAKHYLEAQGGRIGFVSTEGKGSTFWFALPIPEM